MRNEDETLPAADEGPVQRTVRPCARVTAHPYYRMEFTPLFLAEPNVQWFEGMLLYDQSALDATPSAVREHLQANLDAMCANFEAMREEKNRLKAECAKLRAECARLLPEHEAVGLLLCSVSDNLGDMPVSDEWAEKTSMAAHDLLVRNDYFRA